LSGAKDWFVTGTAYMRLFK